MQRTRAALAAATLIALSRLASGEERTPLAPLHVIATEDQSARRIPANGPVRVRLSSAEPRALAEILGLTTIPDQTSFEYVIDQYPQLRSTATRNWLEPTFLIDFNEPEFEPLRTELDARGTKTTRQELVAFVAGLVETSAERGWDLASVVARRRSGDCSEHAVLTTALARLQGIPARVAVGVVLVSDESGFGAFGHAWSEMLEDGRWTVADAALFDLEGAAVRHLPIGLIEDEGMGFTMDLMRTMRIWIERVVLL